MTPDIEIARHLAENGVPIFLAERSRNFPEGGSDGRGYWLPKQWQETPADPAVLDDYKPGMAVCAVMGHTVDAVDKDPRNGGDLEAHLQPKTYGVQATPSGGTHELIESLGVRSRDGIFPGIDVKAGTEGQGVGFIFIAPTERPSHDGSKVATYTWVHPPELSSLTLIGETPKTGAALANAVQDARVIGKNGQPTYDGPDFANLEDGKQVQARQAQEDRISSWVSLLQAAEEWEENHRDYRGRGWEALARDFAWSVASMAANPWMPLTEAEAKDLYESSLPPLFQQTPECRGKFYSGLVDKAESQATEQPPWADFEPIAQDVARALNLPSELDDANLVEWLMEIGLGQRWAWSDGLGWMQWTGKVWENSSVVQLREDLRGVVLALVQRAQESGMDKEYMKQVRALRSANRVFTLANYIRGVHVVDADQFDRQPDKIVVENGVVDLKSGEISPHDPELYMTKIAHAEYRPDARHADWDKILTSLPQETMDWMQVRFGQAATGYPTSDDRMVIGQGIGSNGKTTLMTAIQRTLGGFAVTVPDRILQARPSDHPTELMELRGARVAVIDETPEAGQLNVQRLKTVLGSSTITARKISQDSVTWSPTHSLFVLTNHIPMIRESDDGTWRRLALVKFERRFSQDDAFRARIERSSPSFRSAVLHWIVEGAKTWYAQGRTIGPVPEKVEKDTHSWRFDSDVITEFVETQLEFDPDSCIQSTELYEEVLNWLQARRRSAWSDQLFTSRMSSSYILTSQGVTRKRINAQSTTLTVSTKDPTTAVANFPTVWAGMRWA